MVGGYNKDDVKAYIEKLEKEIERLRSVEESAGLLEKSVEELLEKQRKEQGASWRRHCSPGLLLLFPDFEVCKPPS